MNIYLNGTRVDLNLNGSSFVLNIPSDKVPSTEGVKMFSSDNFILKDSNNLYIIPKEGE
jgi:hypothetical protein